jgi:hypothetical protein
LSALFIFTGLKAVIRKKWSRYITRKMSNRRKDAALFSKGSHGSP